MKRWVGLNEELSLAAEVLFLAWGNPSCADFKRWPSNELGFQPPHPICKDIQDQGGLSLTPSTLVGLALIVSLPLMSYVVPSRSSKGMEVLSKLMIKFFWGAGRDRSAPRVAVEAFDRHTT